MDNESRHHAIRVLKPCIDRRDQDHEQEDDHAPKDQLLLPVLRLCVIPAQGLDMNSMVGLGPQSQQDLNGLGGCGDQEVLIEGTVFA